MDEIKDIVKDPEWQKVRSELVGKWIDDPSWCCNKLKSFLGPITKTTDKKLRIMMNYLTGSGFRSGKIKANCAKDLRLQVSIELKNRKK